MDIIVQEPSWKKVRLDVILNNWILSYLSIKYLKKKKSMNYDGLFIDMIK